VSLYRCFFNRQLIFSYMDMNSCVVRREADVEVEVRDEVETEVIVVAAWGKLELRTMPSQKRVLLGS
jgi:hypothetical protein